MTDWKRIDDVLKDAGLDAEPGTLEVSFTGDYASRPVVIDPYPVKVTLIPRYTIWQRIWAFIRRQKLATAVEIPNATVSQIYYRDDGTASVDIKAQDAE